MAEGEKAIGIDLGTTNSVVAAMVDGKARVIVNQEGSRLTPSVVAFGGDRACLVGESARQQAVTNPRNTVRSIKRFMGRRREEVRAEEKTVPYEISGGPDDFVKVRVNGVDYTPAEISALILRKLCSAAEGHLRHAVRKAVITVPASFSDAQRRATRDAGQIAGLDVVRIISEPTAAALAYSIGQKGNRRLAVFHLGGSTFDISILNVGGGIAEVLATGGDSRLGGDDWDQALINHIVEEFKREQGDDLRKDPVALERLKEAAENAKKDLSFQTQAEINLPFITADQNGPKHLTTTIDRVKFELLTEGLLGRLRDPVLTALEDAQIAASDIEEVLLVGGSTRMPRVRKFIEDVFGREPIKGTDSDELAAIGSALQGAVLTGDVKDLLLRDVTTISLGLETKGGVFTRLIARNTKIPIETRETFTTADDNQSAVVIKVYQGERPMAADNRLLGEFNLEGIPPARMGVPQIEVAFNVDANGILEVSARDKGTGKAHTIKVESSGGLSRDEIERMQRDAEAHAAEDEKRRELAVARNDADQRVNQLEKLLDENKDKLSRGDESAVRAAIDKVNKAKQSEDTGAIRRAIDDLQNASQTMAENLYKSASQSRPSAPGSGSFGGNGHRG